MVFKRVETGSTLSLTARIYVEQLALHDVLTVFLQAVPLSIFGQNFDGGIWKILGQFLLIVDKSIHLQMWTQMLTTYSFLHTTPSVDLW